jgi:hypothetical protein
MHKKWEVLPEPPYVVWMVKHESNRGLLFFGLERLPSKHHTLHDDSVGVHGQDTATKSTFDMKRQTTLTQHLPVATRERAPLGMRRKTKTGEGGNTIGQ